MSNSTETRPIIDSLRGNGKIFKNSLLLCECLYELNVYRDVLNSKIMSGSSGGPEIRGNVHVLDPATLNAIVRLSPDSVLTLHLSESQRLRFLFTAPRRGTVTCSGEIYTE